MGIDLEQRKRGRVTVSRRQYPRSKNVYLNLVHKLYTFLARRTNSNFNQVVARRMAMSKNHRPPVSIGKLATASTKRPNDTLVVVGTITNDQRLLEIPKMTVCALRVTEGARKRILKSGGEVITFDQLALRSPRGKKTYLLRGPLKAREAYRHFNGAPRLRTNGRKFERGRNHGVVKRDKRRLKTN